MCARPEDCTTLRTLIFFWKRKDLFEGNGPHLSRGGVRVLTENLLHALRHRPGQGPVHPVREKRNGRSIPAAPNREPANKSAPLTAPPLPQPQPLPLPQTTTQQHHHLPLPQRTSQQNHLPLPQRTSQQHHLPQRMSQQHHHHLPQRHQHTHHLRCPQTSLESPLLHLLHQRTLHSPSPPHLHPWHCPTI
ncbi:hypothetical protein NL108_018638 [Boleophthalmus pectinirostris]|nr:hypothetical protein NL108_018638 [Boleophthalmus pectinirostris]